MGVVNNIIKPMREAQFVAASISDLATLPGENVITKVAMNFNPMPTQISRRFELPQPCIATKEANWQG